MKVIEIFRSLYENHENQKKKKEMMAKNFNPRIPPQNHENHFKNYIACRLQKL